jgi:hypothetical protein
MSAGDADSRNARSSGFSSSACVRGRPCGAPLITIVGRVRCRGGRRGAPGIFGAGASNRWDRVTGIRGRPAGGPTVNETAPIVIDPELCLARQGGGFACLERQLRSNDWNRPCSTSLNWT